MVVSVRIPTPLRKFTEGKAEVKAEGGNVREVFNHLETNYRGIREKIFDDGGEVRRFINIFLNGEDIRYLAGPDSAVKAGDELSIVPAIAGGESRG